MIRDWIRAHRFPLIVGAAAGIIIGAVIGFVGRPFIVRPSAQLIVTNGMVYGGEVIPPAITGTNSSCQWAIDRYNFIRADFIDFLSRPPIVSRVTGTKIYFSIRSNQYSVDYKIEEIAQWHIAPMISAAVGVDGFYYGAGAAVDYANVGGMIQLLFSIPYTPKMGILSIYARF